MHPAAIEILAAFDNWIEIDTAISNLLDHDRASISDAVAVLRDQGLLLAEGSKEADQDEKIVTQWGPWAPEASLFHYATQDEDYVPTSLGPECVEWRGDAISSAVGEHRVYTLFTGYPEADRLLLPRGLTGLPEPFEQVLYRRRTHRDFSDRPVPLETLSTLLATVFGPVDYLDSGVHALIRRTSASGGSRQEIDAYVGILNVDGVPAGIYHYNALEHSLELLDAGLSPQRVVDLCGRQEWTGTAAFIVVLCMTVDRMLSKYRTPRAYRICLINAGHLGQTFALTATALGLGPFQTAAFSDSHVAEAFRLDNIAQTPLYILAAGYPEANPAMPPRAGLDAFRRTSLYGLGDRPAD
ncbi:SagB/ThcOx family dehydrogenase [Mycobacterium camsae]|uniref:SagB/ThcOx family dehydrogenase n=1 Tax=Mycobacterium gordonae TaxID=1778 RepID=UPI00197E50E8|nr:SagB/ThcOx family dehydrogenase [Mycobacterium gordonae]